MNAGKSLIIGAVMFFGLMAAVSPVNAAALINLIEWPEAMGGNGHTYAVLPMELDWPQARDTAVSFVIEKETGYLATVTSAAENVFIRDNVINDIVSTSILRWVQLLSFNMVVILRSPERS